MDIILTIIGILVLGFILNIILKQSYNFIFFIGQKPFLWLLFMFVAGAAYWGIGTISGLSLSTIAWSSTLALYLNLPPSYKNKEEKISAITLADKMYAEIGIKKGRLLYRIGLFSFAISSITSWILFYGEVCTDAGCKTIFSNLLNM